MGQLWHYKYQEARLLKMIAPKLMMPIMVSCYVVKSSHSTPADVPPRLINEKSLTEHVRPLLPILQGKRR